MEWDMWNSDLTRRWMSYVVPIFGLVRRRPSELVWVGIEKRQKPTAQYLIKYVIINNSAADCSISLKFGTYSADHTTPDVLETLKVNRSKVKVTAWYVSAVKCYKSGKDRFDGIQTWCKLSQSGAQHVSGHQVKYWTRNNSAADCSISLKCDM